MPHVAHGAKSRFHLPAVDENWNTDNNVHPKVRKVHLRYLNAMDQDNMAGHFMPPAPGRPGYKLVQGKDPDETEEIAKSLGLSEFHVDRQKNRIHNGGHLLAFIPMEEYVLRSKERQMEAEFRKKGFHEDIKNRIDEIPGAKGVTIQYGEFMERKAHGERAGQPFVAIDKWEVADD